MKLIFNKKLLELVTSVASKKCNSKTVHEKREGKRKLGGCFSPLSAYLFLNLNSNQAKEPETNMVTTGM